MDVDMDEELTNPAKIRIMQQVNALHGSINKHPRGFFTAPFSCRVNEILINDRTLLRLGQPILKASVPPSFVPVKTSSESEKSRFKKILDQEHSCVGMDPIPDVPVQTSLESHNGSSIPMTMLDDEVVLRRYQNFKKFDIAVDHSDHFFAARRSETQQPDWLNMMKNEWRILGVHLPDTIFVRAYDSRMDLLRAVIIGLEGTPYQDGLFVFDVFFPQNYPNSPPLVHYRSCGQKSINPVINNHTGVGLNLFTAAGTREMLWAPNTNVLQLLVVIQNLILNTKPYFNGFGNASFRKSVYGEWSSLLYNENTIIKSLKTMVYTMNNPPKNFEDLVLGHFRKRAHDILIGCKAYMEGLLVGCLVTDEYEPCSIEFKNDVASCINPLIDAFKKIGAKEAQEFHYLAKKRKAVVKEDIDDAVNRKGKDIDFLSWNVFADRDCVVTKVLIERQTWVEKGQPLYVYDVMELEKVVIPQSTKIARSAYNKVLMVNHKSRVGIFSMEDVFAPQEFDCTIPMARPSNESVMKRYGNFKKFESVMDCSDHFFSEQSSAMNQGQFQPPSYWANNIREELRILEEKLPDTIFVRVYESRMDLLRAVIIGPKGTPYHGGLFFFDVCFPSDYPNRPPLVHYHSCGFAINPNLSKGGKVRLSLPRKTGGQRRMWLPGRSTVLRLLIAMQKWIFNAQPLFNDFTYAIISDTSYGQQFSVRYNENIRIKSFNTMLHIMDNPPKNFEDFVPGYFCKCAREILTTACDQNPYSATYEKDLYLFSEPLATAFWNMGANKMKLSFSKKK